MFLFFSWEKEIDNLASPHLYFEMDIDTSSGLELTLVYIFFLKGLKMIESHKIKVGKKP